MSLRSILVILILLCLCKHAEAQHSIEFNSLSGFKVFSPGNYSLSGMSHGGELAFNLSQENRQEEWIKRLRISEIGLVGGFHNMGSVQIADSAASKGFLQNVFTLSGRLNHELYQGRIFSVSVTAGIGLAYSTSSYFSDDNPIVGSKINFSPQAGLKLKAAISEDLSLASAVSIFHYSNAAMQVPNKGVNALQGSFGLAYRLPLPVERSTTKYKDTTRHFLELGFNTGRRGAFKSKAGNWKSGLSVHYGYSFNSVVRLQAGADAVYYYTVFDGTNERYQYLATSLHPWRVGVSGGTEASLGRLGVGINLGYYINYKSFYPVNTYWTTSFKYYVTRVLGLQSKVYFHQAQADYVGFGIVLRGKRIGRPAI